MKITVVNSLADLSGGSRVQASHWDALARRGHEVSIVSQPHPPIRWKRAVKDLLRGRGLPKRPARSGSHFDGIAASHRVLPRPRPVTDDDLPDADLVIATWWETAEWVHRLSPRKGVKVSFIQGHEVFAAADDTQRRRIEATYRLPMRRIVISEWLRTLVRDRYGVEDAVLVPNAVDHGLFHAPPREKNARPTVGFLYSTAPFKGCDIAARAIELARERIPDLHVVAFGVEPPHPSVPVPAGTEFTQSPPQPRIREIYARCDAWLFASRNDGFGLPLLEAMACRTPILAVPVGAGLELASDGAGVLVPEEDPHAMADAIVRVCSLPPSEWRALSDRAHDRALGYQWERSFDRMEQALAGFLADARGRSAARSVSEG